MLYCPAPGHITSVEVKYYLEWWEVHMGTHLFYNVCVNRQPSDMWWFDSYSIAVLIETYIIIIQEYGTTTYYTKIFSQDSLFIYITSIFLLKYNRLPNKSVNRKNQTSYNWMVNHLIIDPDFLVDAQMHGKAKEILEMLRNAELKVEDRFYNRTISGCRF